MLLLTTPLKFKELISVRVDDINFGGHLDHAKLISLMHQARVQVFKKLGVNELDCSGNFMVMRNLEIKYSSQSYLNDLLEMDLEIDINRVCVVINYEIFNLTQNKKTARAMAQMAVLHPKTHQVLSPQVFLEAINKQGIIHSLLN